MPSTMSPLLGDQPLKLGLFAFNASGGMSMTEAPRSLEITWEHQKKIAQTADRLGLDVIVPVGRWKGMGGNTNFNGRSFETFTWAAGMAEATERITVVATTHVATIDPMVAAKMAATVDHISEGRFAMNIVMGWNKPEMDMMQCELLDHDERYQYGAEWIEFVEQAWSTDAPFDIDGKFFRAVGCESEPKPLQLPRPTVINAGNSPTGMDFSAKYADINFFVSADLDEMSTHSAYLKRKAHDDYAREIHTMTGALVICRDTEAEARKVYDEILEKGDWPGAEKLTTVLGASGSGDGWREQMTRFQERFILGYGTMPLIGTPEQVVEGFQKMAGSGMEGVLLGFLNYAEELDYLGENVLPLMCDAGLRN